MTRTPSDLHRRLGRLLTLGRVRLFVAGMLVAGGVALLGRALAALAVGWAGTVAVPWKVLAVAAVASVAGFALLERVILPLFDLGGVRRFAGRLDRHGRFRNVLIAAEEVERNPDRWSGNDVAAAAAERLGTRAAAELERVDVPRLLGLPRLLPALGLGLGAVGLALLPDLLVPEIVERGRERLSAPRTEEVWTPTSGIYLETRELAIPLRDSAVVSAVDLGAPREMPVCEVRPEFGSWRPVPVRRDSLAGPAPLQRYVALVEDLTEDQRVRFRRDGMVTREGILRVLHPPRLVGLGLQIAPPAYTRLPTRNLDPCPSRVSVPAGSGLTWRGRANVDLAAAAFRNAEGDSLAWSVEGDSLALSWTAREDGAWRLDLSGTHGIEAQDPVRREVAVVPDAAPRIRLVVEPGGGRLPGDGRVLLELEAEDDFGLASLRLLARREGAWDAPADTAWSALELSGRRGGALALPGGEIAVSLDGPGPIPQSERWEGGVHLDASGVGLMPGDELLLAVAVADNRRPGPPGRARSRTVRLSIPAAADLLAEQVAQEGDRLEDLDSLRRRGAEMREELGRLERELRKDADLDFARRQELEDAVARQRELQGELDAMTSDLRADLDRLLEHAAVSPQLVERMEQVAALLEEIENEELRRLQERLREAMDQLSEKEISEAMADVAENQDEFLDRLDRAIAQLEELRRAQRMEELVAEVEDLMREQDRLQDESGAEAAARQEELARRAEDLAEQLRETLEELENRDPDTSAPAAEAMEEALREALAALEEADPAEAMREAAEAMAQADPQEGEPAGEQPADAGEESSDSDGETGEDSGGGEIPPGDPGDQASHEALRRLASLYHVLMQGQGMMQAAVDQFVAEVLRGLAFDLLELSRRQEALTVEIPRDLRDVRNEGLARRQMTLLRATAALRDRLAEALAQSAGLSSRMLRDLDGIIDLLDDAAGHLEAGWAGPASKTARTGLGAVNRLVVSLLTSASMSGGGGGGSSSMPSLGQRLEQMAKEQAGLNGLTQQLRSPGGQGLSQQQRAQMRRLQADQQGLAGGMKEAERERAAGPESERLLGDLAELAREMERVADDLGAGRVDEQTLRRQERILSRMLDARNSVRRRDYSRKREGRTGRELFRVQQGEVPQEVPEAAPEGLRLRRDQLDHVPGDYRDLVRRYFRALEDLRGSAEDAGGGR